MNTPLFVLSCLSLVLAGSAAVCPAEEAVLPEGGAPAPVQSGYFPDRAHAFVWRNWGCVPPSKMARLLGAREEDMTAMAVSMGLPADAAVSPEMRTRGYVTLIRRNWHLLPYEQLLELLELSPERLGFMLREEDFLWIKLGRLKPKCEPVRYQPPDETARKRATEIARVVSRDFGEALGQPMTPRFDFVRELDAPRAHPPAAAQETGDSPPCPRLVYSYVAVYGDPLLEPGLNPYPDGLLERLAAAGINGVWLQGVLRDLAPGGPAFPELGAHHEKRLTNLRALVERAAKFGVRVFLYLNEPRAMPGAFFEKRPDMAGVGEEELTALCTSHPAVRQWMGDALAHVFRAVPGLGGVYVITASENLTNCASHGGWQSCPRCKTRTDADIITEVAGVIEEGVHRGSPEARVLISDWGWRGHGNAPDMITRLPKSVTLMSVSEWSLPIERGGVQSTVGEYSISAVGPGPRAQSHWKVARDFGLATGTEIQFNNTCEIASIPYLPVMDLIAAHCANLHHAQLNAMLIGWTMGGYPSPNFSLAARISGQSAPDAAAALDAVAQERFGAEGQTWARRAWSRMSETFREYPFHISVVYTSPVQVGPANPVYPERTGYSATMWGIPYDDLDGWRGPYPPEVFAAQFEKVAEGFRAGAAELQTAVEHAPAESREEAASDLRMARAAGMHFQSVANQARYILARDALGNPATPPEEAPRLRAEIRRRLESEIALAQELFGLVREDSRIGFEPSCQYFYLPGDLMEKVVNCRWLLERYAE